MMHKSSLALLAVIALATAGCPAPMPGPDAGDSGTTNDVRTNPNDGGTNPNDGGTNPNDSGGPVNCGSGMGPCNPVTNAGCQAGEACVRAMTSGGQVTTQCVTAGTAGFGGDCTQPTDCREGFVCLSTGKCHKLCCGAGDDSTCRDTAGGGLPNATCSIQISDQGGGATGLFACQLPTRCDPFAQDCPTATDNCQYTRADGTTQCVPSGTATDGMTCNSTTPCAQGFLCIGSGASGTCRKYCNPMAPGDAGAARTCPSGFQCGGVSQLPNNFGVCVPMM
jgi:hypothetical protein